MIELTHIYEVKLLLYDPASELHMYKFSAALKASKRKHLLSLTACAHQGGNGMLIYLFLSKNGTKPMAALIA